MPLFEMDNHARSPTCGRLEEPGRAVGAFYYRRTGAAPAIENASTRNVNAKGRT